MFWFFGLQGMWDLSSRPGIEPTPPALEGKVLTTGLPGKSPVPEILCQTLCELVTSSWSTEGFSGLVFPLEVMIIYRCPIMYYYT